MTITQQQYFGIARKIVSNVTTESWETIPHVCVTDEPEISAFLQILDEINEGKEKSEHITVNTAMLRIIVECLKACPKMNSHLHFNKKLVTGRLDTFENIDISMPVMLKTGEMMTINMHSFEKKTMSQMRDEIHLLISQANNSDMEKVMMDAVRDNSIQELKKGKIAKIFYRLIGLMAGKNKLKTIREKATKFGKSSCDDSGLTKKDIEQGTITVSNLGSIYRDWEGECTILEIIPPQVVAIGIGAIKKNPVCDDDGNVHAGVNLPITIAFDHRALDMGDIVPFMKKLDEIFKSPAVIKGWV